jgi:Spy/CpxP family protein refolding chaperone
MGRDGGIGAGATIMIWGRAMGLRAVAVVSAVAAYTATITTRPATATNTATAKDPATETLLNWLGASAQQRQELATKDVEFGGELKQLKADLETKRKEFAAALERTDTPGDTILAKLEAMLAADAALQRRIARYLLSVRDHLTPEQQQKVFGLCAEEARHGRQWRGGRGNSEPAGGGGGGQQGRGRHGWRGGRN